MRVLADYVEGITADQLQLSLFAGEVTLKDLKFKPDALDKLGLPFVAKHGHIHSLRVEVATTRAHSTCTTCMLPALTHTPTFGVGQVSWTLSKPIKIELDGVYLLVDKSVLVMSTTVCSRARTHAPAL